jgi:hypothetical protein
MLLFGASLVQTIRVSHAGCRTVAGTTRASSAGASLCARLFRALVRRGSNTRHGGRGIAPSVGADGAGRVLRVPLERRPRDRKEIIVPGDGGKAAGLIPPFPSSNPGAPDNQSGLQLTFLRHPGISAVARYFAGGEPVSTDGFGGFEGLVCAVLLCIFPDQVFNFEQNDGRGRSNLGTCAWSNNMGVPSALPGWQ